MAIINWKKRLVFELQWWLVFQLELTIIKRQDKHENYAAYIARYQLHKGEDMDGTIEINGIKYKAKHTTDKITLQRYNEKHKMWVNLHFPKGNQAEGKKIEEDIIQILSNLYIEREAGVPGRR